jgi:hypothetical protein
MSNSREVVVRSGMNELKDEYLCHSRFFPLKRCKMGSMIKLYFKDE